MQMMLVMMSLGTGRKISRHRYHFENRLVLIIKLRGRYKMIISAGVLCKNVFRDVDVSHFLQYKGSFSSKKNLWW